MNNEQIPFLVEGILITVCAIFGLLLSRSGKPYGKVKLVIHIFLYAWLTFGFGFISYGYFTMNDSNEILLLVSIMGIMIITQLTTGLIIMTSKIVGITLVRLHIASAILMFLSDISAFILAGSHSQ